MERSTEQEVNDGEFDPRKQASLVNRALAFFCCALFLFWTARARDLSNPASISPAENAAQTESADDEQSAALAEGALLEAKKSADESTKIPPLKLTLLIDLNTATKAELTNLPGIGEALAGRIVELRESAGAFSDVEELLEVKGIGPKKFAAIRPFCVVGEVEEDEGDEETEQ